MRKVKIGIIGLGAIGERLIGVFLKHDGFEIGCVYDSSMLKLEEISSKYKLLKASDLEEMLMDESIDAIYLAVPPKYHADLAIQVMKAGKHILCEKPLAGSLDEAKAMLEESVRCNVVNAMNFPLNYTSAYEKIKEMLKADALGEIRRIEVTGLFPNWPRLWQINPWIDSRDQGGFTREVFTHFVQLVISTFGSIKLIKAEPQYLEANRSETGLMAFGYVNDAYPLLISGLSGIGHEEEIKLIIYGTNGSVELVGWRDLFYLNSDGRSQLNINDVNASWMLIDAFYRKILGENVPVIDFKVGYETTLIIESMLK